MLLENIDCMELMARYPDKYFDPAIVDPPYGINMDGGKYGIDGAAEAKTYTKKDCYVLKNCMVGK